METGSGRGFAADLHIQPRFRWVFARHPEGCLPSFEFAGGIAIWPLLKRLRVRRADMVGERWWAAGGPLSQTVASDCTEFEQGPVDELHLIENRADRVPLWELTLFSPSIDSLSFFERFRTVFPVGGESGAQAQLTAVRTAKKAGIAGQRSWFWQAHAASAGSRCEPEQRQPRRRMPYMGRRRRAIPQADAERR